MGSHAKCGPTEDRVIELMQLTEATRLAQGYAPAWIVDMARPLLNVYVPVENQMLGIKPGSAVVGRESVRDPDAITVYFEGGIYNQRDSSDFDWRLLHAAGRCLENYPTVAKMTVGPGQLLYVGTYDYDTRQLDVDDQATLDAWIAQWKPGRW